MKLTGTNSLTNKKCCCLKITKIFSGLAWWGWIELPALLTESLTEAKNKLQAWCIVSSRCRSVDNFELL